MQNAETIRTILEKITLFVSRCKNISFQKKLKNIPPSSERRKSLLCINWNPFLDKEWMEKAVQVVLSYLYLYNPTNQLLLLIQIPQNEDMHKGLFHTN